MPASEVNWNELCSAKWFVIIGLGLATRVNGSVFPPYPEFIQTNPPVLHVKIQALTVGVSSVPPIWPPAGWLLSRSTPQHLTASTLSVKKKNAWKPGWLFHRTSRLDVTKSRRVKQGAVLSVEGSSSWPPGRKLSEEAAWVFSPGAPFRALYTS